MSVVTIAGLNIDVNDEGYLTDPSQWNEEVAAVIANEEEVELTEKHFELLNFLRKQHEDDVDITIRKVGKSGIVDRKISIDPFIDDCDFYTFIEQWNA